MKNIWLIDKGHGGFINGVYQTAPDKMFHHSDYEIFYEGVFNRIIGDKLLRKLWDKGIYAIDLCPTELDVPLSVRVDNANNYYRAYPNAVLLSLHSNASENHDGNGFEVWTSIGQTRSDKYAEVLAHEIMAKFEMPFRSDKADDDLDKESQFYILKWTHCPAVLPECLFFDNYDNYKMLSRPDFQERYVDTLVNFILKSELVIE